MWECLLPALSSSISHRVFPEGWTKQGGITLTKTSVDPWRRFFWIFAKAKGLERNCFLVASSKKKTINAARFVKDVLLVGNLKQKEVRFRKARMFDLGSKELGSIGVWGFDESTNGSLMSQNAWKGIPKRYFIHKIPCSSSGSFPV